MSVNRLNYDACAYAQALTQSVSPLSYILDRSRYEHVAKCRVELGLVGGTSVSHVSGNLVDLENDLRNQNRPNTHCPAYKYLPSDAPFVQGKEYIKPVVHPKVSIVPQHLAPCQMINYGAVPLAPALNTYHCNQYQ